MIQTLKRVGEMNKNHWLVLTFGPLVGVPLRLFVRSLNPFAWAVVGMDTLICLLWMVPLAILARLAGLPSFQGHAILFYSLAACCLALGLASMWSEIRFMDRNNGEPRSMFSDTDMHPPREK